MNITLIFILIFTINCLNFTKIVTNIDKSAICLDGQPGFIYIGQNWKQQAQGLIIYFMDSPSSYFCGNSTLFSSLDNCLLAFQQIKNYWQPTLNINNSFLNDKKYQGWNKAIMSNCDGSIYQGYSNNSIKYKDKQLFFRGNSIIISNFNYILKNINLTNTKNIVIVGSKLGAIGALTWSRYFRDQTLGKNKINYLLILDNYPSNYPDFKSKQYKMELWLQNMMKLSNIDQSYPFSLCSLRKQQQQWKCFLFQQNQIYIDLPILVIDSQYDWYTVNKVIGLNCIDYINNQASLNKCNQTQISYLNQFRADKLISNFHLVNKQVNGMWSINIPYKSLLQSDSYQSQAVKVGGKTISQAVNIAINSKRNVAFDAYPS